MDVQDERDFLIEDFWIPAFAGMTVLSAGLRPCW